MSGGWAVAPSVSLALREWNGEAVVHDARSNDTHRLSRTAALVLRRLIDAEAGEGVELAFPSVSDDEIEATLAVLGDLGLLEQC